MLSGGRNSEFDPVRCALDAAAYQNWLEHPHNDNPDRVRVLKALKMALDQELSDCQRRYVTAYYVEGLTVTQVAERYHINRATDTGTGQTQALAGGALQQHKTAAYAGWR